MSMPIEAVVAEREEYERRIAELQKELDRVEGVLVAADRVYEAYQAMLENRNIGALPDWTKR